MKNNTLPSSLPDLILSKKLRTLFKLLESEVVTEEREAIILKSVDTKFSAFKIFLSLFILFIISFSEMLSLLLHLILIILSFLNRSLRSCWYE